MLPAFLARRPEFAALQPVFSYATPKCGPYPLLGNLDRCAAGAALFRAWPAGCEGYVPWGLIFERTWSQYAP